MEGIIVRCVIGCTAAKCSLIVGLDHRLVSVRVENCLDREKIVKKKEKEVKGNRKSFEMNLLRKRKPQMKAKEKKKKETY